VYVYRNGPRSSGVRRGSSRWSEDVFFVEAEGAGGGHARIEFDRSEAIRLRNNLNRLLKGTAPKPKPRKKVAA